MFPAEEAIPGQENKIRGQKNSPDIWPNLIPPGPMNINESLTTEAFPYLG